MSQEIPFAVTDRQVPHGHIVRISGSIDVDHDDLLRRALENISKTCHRPVVLDLSGMTFISSMGLGVLIEFRNTMLSRNIPTHLAGANADITSIFAKTRLSELFPMYDDAEQALKEAEKFDH